ncbi:MAG: VapA/VapB family virulence-associated protein [bacterium]|nr:VapA/VapB family virulence-associated protein [Myxococcales bacterium]MCB9542397.1 VapA/VapB family virulence-associated protein [Myxococcales bacterium]
MSDTHGGKSPAVDRAALISGFRERLTGRLPQDKIDAASAKLEAATTSYSANGSIASAIFYLKVQVKISGGETFNGNAGGVATPGGGALFGDVYTDDINALYANTKSFELNAAAAYTSVLFFDGSSNLLGHFESGSVSTVIGVFGGKGSW